MAEPSFKELFSLRSRPGEEIVERFGATTRSRFDYERGVPLVVCASDDTDVPFLLAALGRSNVPIAPIVVDNAPGRGGADSVARKMGACVVEESTPGQMSALQTGLKKATLDYPKAPILVVDDDSLPQKHWAETMINYSGLRRAIGGVAYGGVIIEHGPSMATDMLRTIYAFSADIHHKLSRGVPKARGSNGILQLDADNNILTEIMTQPPNVFPCDAAVEDSVIAAGGEATSIFHPYAVMFTRGDRFRSVRALARDFAQRGEHRIELYDQANTK